jgi:hypothetical protein
MTKSFFTVRDEAYSDMADRKQKLLNRSNDAYKQGDLPTMRKAHSLAMKQDARTRAKYPDESIKRTMSGATQDYAKREKSYGPGKVRDSVEYPENTNVVSEEGVEEGILDFMSSTPAKPKSKLSLSAMREISRRDDMKKNMGKAIRSQNEPQSMSYRTVRSEENEIEEAKKMKGKDPCWTGYHMLGTKPKGDKQVPNCVPEETEHVTEKFWDNEGEMIQSQLNAIIDKAQQICDKLKDDDNLEAWIQSEVTTASDAITCVYDHLMYGKDVKEEVIDEQQSARLRMAKALQKAKQDRERSERNGQRLLNPDGKEMGEPKEKIKEHSSAQRAAIAIAKQKSGKYDENGKRIKEDTIAEEKPGLYANIHAKQRRIKNGSGEHMRKPGSKGAPTAQAFKDSQKTVKENIDANIDEGIARLISKSIKRVTSVKPTPQQKADIRLNK